MALYALNEEYRLRGWDKLPYAVVDTRTGQTVFPPKHVMETLLLCDGTHDLDSLLVPTQTKDDLAALVARGYVRPAAEGETIAREQRYLRYENRFVATAHWALTGRSRGAATSAAATAICRRRTPSSASSRMMP